LPINSKNFPKKNYKNVWFSKFPKKLQECLIFFCLRFAHKLQKFSQKIYKNVWFFKKKLQECLIFFCFIFAHKLQKFSQKNLQECLIFQKKITRMSDFFVLDLLTNFKNKQKKFTRMSDFSKKNYKNVWFFCFRFADKLQK